MSVRNHFVPRHYLNGFTEPITGIIYVYRRDGSRPFKASTANVGLENEYYSDEAETYLTEVIEANGNPVLDKIRQGKSITRSDKRALSEYISALVKRGPWSENRFKQGAPNMIEDIGASLQETIKQARKRDPSNEGKYNKQILEVEETMTKLKSDPPKSAWEAGFSPHMTPELIDALSNMTWVFLVNQDPVFLTSDNPVFIFNIGLGKKNSELSFPVSSKVVLWGSRRTDLNEGYLEAQGDIIAELNRRTGATVIRHLFAGFEAQWTHRIATRKYPLRFLGIPKWNNRKIADCYDFTLSA